MQTIVYGLGEVFHKYQDYVMNHYGTLLFSDRNEKLAKDYPEQWISKKDIPSVIQDMDCLLICIYNVDMPALLTEFHAMGVPYSKIRVLDYEIRTREARKEEYYFGMSFGGQFQDDAFISFIFSKIGRRLRDVYYLEIGTNDAVCSNNTWNLYRCGARGTLVDPLPACEYLASLIRPEDHFIRAAIGGSSDAGGRITFYVGKGTQISSVNKSVAGDNVEEIEVDVVDINQLLSPETNLLVIDAEGEDENILKSIDYSINHPEVIEFEVNKADEESINSFLKEKGYTLFLRLISNEIFIRNDLCEFFAEWAR